VNGYGKDKPMKMMRKIIEIDDELCDGCGECVPSCAEGAIEVTNGKARVVADKYCDGLGACLGECPNGALEIVEREAEDFDEEAVEIYLKEKEQKPVEEAPMACGCPSSQLQAFIPASPAAQTAAGDSAPGGASSLSHWPVQIRLVPPTAPFLQGADLLVSADCTPFAYPDFHRDLLKGKVLMVGCPKFDDVEGYIAKFTEIFKNAGINSITTVVMEVPCCSGLPLIVKKALEASGKEIPLEEVVISMRGDVLKR
jgi:ferredoxin